MAETLLVIGGQKTDKNRIKLTKTDELDTISKVLEIDALEIFNTSKKFSASYYPYYIYYIYYIRGTEAKNKILTNIVITGHSLGQIIAISLAGYLSFEQGLKFLKYKTEKFSEENYYFQSYLIKYENIEKLLEINNQKSIHLGIVNPNKKGIIYSSEELTDDDKKQFGILFSKKIDFSHPYHSSLMEKSKKEIKEYIETIEFKQSNIKVLSNYTGDHDGQ